MNSAPEAFKFAVRLGNRRRAAGITQSELALRTKMKPSAISHFECGRREPNLVNLSKLCVALGVSADDLLGLSKTL